MRELLERLFQVDFLKGLAVTFRAQNQKNIVTEQYPLERPMVAERYRGAPHQLLAHLARIVRAAVVDQDDVVAAADWVRIERLAAAAAELKRL